VSAAPSLSMDACIRTVNSAMSRSRVTRRRNGCPPPPRSAKAFPTRSGRTG
jgi:hypothetical protein